MGVMLLMTVQAMGEMAIMVRFILNSVINAPKSDLCPKVSGIWWFLHSRGPLHRSFMGIRHGLELLLAVGYHAPC